ncbi:ribonuclease H-like domain-containing protein [Tanacetum coccineum]
MKGSSVIIYGSTIINSTSQEKKVKENKEENYTHDQSRAWLLNYPVGRLGGEKERKKGRTTLLMALPEDHLAKFHKMTDAKDMWDAIKSRFSGNDESKKMQKYILKQQFEGFSVSNSEGLHKGYDRFQSLLSQLEIHGAVAMISMRLKKFYKKTERKLHFDAKEPVGFDKTKVECYNCHKKGHFARECRSKGNTGYKSKDYGRRPGK